MSENKTNTNNINNRLYYLEHNKLPESFSNVKSDINNIAKKLEKATNSINLKINNVETVFKKAEKEMKQDFDVLPDVIKKISNEIEDIKKLKDTILDINTFDKKINEINNTIKKIETKETSLKNDIEIIRNETPNKGHVEIELKKGEKRISEAEKNINKKVKAVNKFQTLIKDIAKFSDIENVKEYLISRINSINNDINELANKAEFQKLKSETDNKIRLIEQEASKAKEYSYNQIEKIKKEQSSKINDKIQIIDKNISEELKNQEAKIKKYADNKILNAKKDIQINKDIINKLENSKFVNYPEFQKLKSETDNKIRLIEQEASKTKEYSIKCHKQINKLSSIEKKLAEDNITIQDKIQDVITNKELDKFKKQQYNIIQKKIEYIDSKISDEISELQDSIKNNKLKDKEISKKIDEKIYELNNQIKAEIDSLFHEIEENNSRQKLISKKIISEINTNNESLKQKMIELDKKIASKNKTIDDFERKIASDNALLKELKKVNDNILHERKYDIDKIKIEKKIIEEKNKQVENFKSIFFNVAIGVIAFAIVGYYYYSSQGLLMPQIGEKLIFIFILLIALGIIIFLPKKFYINIKDKLTYKKDNKTIPINKEFKKPKLKNKWNKFVDFLIGK
jgi:hypothetical protein